MKLINAYYCPDCEEVFDYSKYSACPSCTNRSVIGFLVMISKRRESGEAQNIDARRYGKVRIMHPVEFAKIWNTTIQTGKYFDEMVDEWKREA